MKKYSSTILPLATLFFTFGLLFSSAFAITSTAQATLPTCTQTFNGSPPGGVINVTGNAFGTPEIVVCLLPGTYIGSVTVQGFNTVDPHRIKLILCEQIDVDASLTIQGAQVWSEPEFWNSTYPRGIPRSVSSGNTVIENTEVTCDPLIDPVSTDVSVQKSVAPTTAQPGDIVTYTVDIANAGGAATGVIVTDALPAGLTDLSVVGAVPAGTTSTTGDVLSWNIGAMADGDTGTITYIAQVDPNLATSTVSIANTADITAIEDTTSGNNDATATLTIGRANIGIVKTMSPATAQPGDTVTIVLTIGNTGNVTAIGVTAADTIDTSWLTGAAVTGTTGDAVINGTTGMFAWTLDDIPAGGSGTITIEGTVDSTITAAQTGNNTATVNATNDSDSSNNSSPDSIDILLPDVSVTKSAVLNGTTIDYTIVVTNGGNTAYDIDLVDAIPAELNSTDCQANQTINVAANSSQTIVCSGTIDGVSVVRTPAVQTIAVGDTATFAITVTNDSDSAITNFGVADSESIVCSPAAPASLPVGGIYNATCTETGVTLGYTSFLTVMGDINNVNVVTASVSTIPAISDIASVTTIAPVSDTVDNDVVTVGFELEKIASANAAAIGETITYTYIVHNNGSAAMSGISVVDDLLGAVPFPDTIVGNSSMTATLTTIVMESDLPGPIVNVVTLDSDGMTGDAMSVSVDVVSNPAIQVVKTAANLNATVGETILYTYIITNMGDVTLSSIDLFDDPLGTIDLANDPLGTLTLDMTSLAPGESTVVTATYTVQESDIGTDISNTAYVTATTPLGNDITDSSEIVLVPSYSINGISINKIPPTGQIFVGDTIVYTYVATNLSNVALSIDAMDDPLGAIPFPAMLAAGEVATATLEYVVTAEDVTGVITNTASIIGTTATGDIITDTTPVIEVTANGSPALVVEKQADLTDATVGSTILYTYTIRNMGDIDLTDLTLVDDPLGVISLDVTTLAPGESTVATASYTVQESDIGQPILNTATATGMSLLGEISDSTQVVVVSTFSVNGLVLEKTAAPLPANVGETIIYTYIIRNVGNTAVTDLVLTDDPLGDIALPSTTLAAGESMSATAEYTVQESDLGGAIVNTAEVVGNTPTGTVTDDVPPVSVSTMSNPAFELEKIADVTSATYGDTIVYTYIVRNTGDVTLSDINVVDDPLGAVPFGSTELAPGQMMTATLSYVVQESDMGTSIRNTATAMATTPDDQTLTDSTPEVTVLGVGDASVTVDIVASVPVAGVDQTVVYTYTIVNNGDVPLTNLVLQDNQEETIPLPAISLSVGEEMIVNRSYIVRGADVNGQPMDSNAVITADTPDGVSITDNDNVSVDTVDIRLTKSPLQTSLARVGDLVKFEMEATNPGSAAIIGVLVDDYTVGSDCMEYVTATLPPTIADETTTQVEWSNVVVLPGDPLNVIVTFRITADKNECPNDATFSTPLYGIEERATTVQPTAVTLAVQSASNSIIMMVLFVAVVGVTIMGFGRVGSRMGFKPLRR